MIRLTAERTPAGTSYLATGQGHPVVLIHGVGLNKEMWGGQIVGLAPHFQVIAYDMLGHGDSPLPAPGTSLEGYAEQLRELIEHLGLPHVSVIGFSMGGLVARAFALHHPQLLDSLVILNSVFNRSAEQRAGVIERTRQAAEHGPDANAEAALSRWFSHEYQAANPAQIAAIRQTLAETPGIMGVHDIRTRKMGDMVVVDAHIEVDATLTVEAGHDIAVEARRRVMQRHRVLNLMTHVDPWRRPDGDHEKVSVAAG